MKYMYIVLNIQLSYLFHSSVLLNKKFGKMKIGLIFPFWSCAKYESYILYLISNYHWLLEGFIHKVVTLIFRLYYSGGRVDMFNIQTEHIISGIFIKHVLEDSPAGRNGTLKTGDRILEVSVIESCIR